MINYIVLSIIITTFILASYEDIKKREVYDYLNFLLTFLIIIVGIFHSLIIQSLIPLKAVGFGLLVGFALGSFLYYVGLWGGGDSKFLIGFSTAAFYLINFTTKKSNLEQIYNMLIENLTLVIELFISSLKKIILIIDFIVIILLILLLIFSVKKKEKIQLTLCLILLSIGLLIQTNELYLTLIGFIVFLILFFGDEDIFSSIFLPIKKNPMQLKKGDKIDSDIKVNKKLIIKFIDAKEGLTNEQITKIQNHKKEIKTLYIRKILPISQIVAINFILYILLIITLSKINIEIISFLIKFLIVSFFIGGILGIIIISFFTIKYFKEIKITISNLEKKIIIIYLILILILTAISFISFNNVNQLFLLLFVPLYFLLKVAKQIETKIFVSKKNIAQIVPGDWIVEDIKVNNKKVFDKEDFKLGINEKQLERLNELSKTHKNLKQIKVKDGIPFLPPLFIGFLIILFI